MVPRKGKKKKRKWVRFERQYSNAIWHTDWHVMKDSRVRDLNLITYLDDASRCVTGYGMFKEATGLNAVKVLRQAILAFGTPSDVRKSLQFSKTLETFTA